MRDLQMIANECMEELDALDIPYSNDVEFRINTRAKRRWGKVSRLPDGGFRIEINSSLLDESNDCLRGLKNTIIHELLHTCDGCMNHGKNWKDYAEMVNARYDYGVKRCNSSEEKGVTEPVMTRATRPSNSYMIQCESCGNTHMSSRLSKTIQHPEWYRCARCGGNFFRVF